MITVHWMDEEVARPNPINFRVFGVFRGFNVRSWAQARAASLIQACPVHGPPRSFSFQQRCDLCPCGYFGDPERECRGTPNQLRAYRQRLSGPLLDRIDIHIEVPSVDFRDLNRADSGEPSDAIRARIEAAHFRTLDRTPRRRSLYSSTLEQENRHRL
ncbi:MAG: ATP-binding protein [Verrucomicrobiales bacterium]